MKEKNKVIKFLIPIICLVIVICGLFFIFNNHNNNSVKKPDLKDDFYDSINYKNNNYIFEKAQAEVIQNLAGLVMTIEYDPNFSNDNFFNFFETFEDTETRDKNGISELKEYFDKIDNAKNIDEFTDIMLKVDYDLNVKSFLNWELAPDIYNNSRNVVVFEPMALEKLSTFLLEDSMPSGLEFFTNDKYKSYKKALEDARIKYFKEYGYDDEKAKTISNNITEFAKTIQDKSLPIEELHGNLTDHLKDYSYYEVKSMFKNLPIDKFLSKFNLNKYPYYSLIDEEHLKALDNYYTNDNLPLMKEILKLLILEDVASLYSSTNYANILLNAYVRISGEFIDMDSLMGYFETMKMKPRMLGAYLNVKYDENYFTEIEKQEIIELINKVKTHYKEVINNSEWLNDSTKSKAIKKLDNIKTNVGYVQKEEEKDNFKLVSKDNGGTVLSNYIIMNQAYSNETSKRITKKIEQPLDHFQVNAYYNPIDNSINFPSAFREIYRDLKDKYDIYAYAGMIIAHEISHAFDNNGSKYDEVGNLSNWWTEEDRANFDKLKDKIINYYSNYEMFGIKIDGKITVGENIADLAAVNTIVSIMESENATPEDFKKFFESYAKLWNDNLTKKQFELQSLSDNHSPNKIRVNAVLSSIDKFYEVYDIKENDKMFVKKEDRVGLW